MLNNCKVVLTFESVRKSCGVTFQMNPLLQYFHQGAICFSSFHKMNFGSSAMGQGCSNKAAKLVCKLFGVTSWVWQFLGSLGNVTSEQALHFK